MKCLVPMLLCGALVPISAHAQERLHDNIVVVLDASGSMNGRMPNSRQNKMDAAKDALWEVMKDIPPSTNVGLLVFSHRNSRQLGAWPYPLGPANRSQLRYAIYAPLPGGGTPLGQYLKIGADKLLEQRQKQRGYGSYRLLVVTDGQASDAYLLRQYLPDVLSRGITVDVIGVAMNSNHQLATEVHSYRNANDPASLKQAVSNVFAEVSTGDDDSTSEEDFALLASLPDGAAEKMLETLANSGNHPIGTEPAPTIASSGTNTYTMPQRTQPQRIFVPPPSSGPKMTFFSTVTTILGTFCIIMFVLVGGAIAGAVLLLNQHKRRYR